MAEVVSLDEARGEWVTCIVCCHSCGVMASAVMLESMLESCDLECAACGERTVIPVELYGCVTYRSSGSVEKVEELE